MKHKYETTHMLPGGKVRWVKGFGPFAEWCREKYEAGINLPYARERRFNQFLVEKAKPIPQGSAHLHLFWDQQGGTSYWKVVSRGNTVCTIPGRCQIVWLSSEAQHIVDAEPKTVGEIAGQYLERIDETLLDNQTDVEWVRGSLPGLRSF